MSWSWQGRTTRLNDEAGTSELLHPATRPVPRLEIAHNVTTTTTWKGTAVGSAAQLLTLDRLA